MKLFEYYEIRPCVEFEGDVVSYLGDPQHVQALGDKVYTREGALLEAQHAFYLEGGKRLFWSIYGRFTENGVLFAQAIGDFDTFADAFEVLQAILVPFRNAEQAQDWTVIDDICNQSTNEDRL